LVSEETSGEEKMKKMIRQWGDKFVNLKTGVGNWNFVVDFWVVGGNIDEVNELLNIELEAKGLWGYAADIRYECLSIKKNGKILLKARFKYLPDESDLE